MVGCGQACVCVEGPVALGGDSASGAVTEEPGEALSAPPIRVKPRPQPPGLGPLHFPTDLILITYEPAFSPAA